MVELGRVFGWIVLASFQAMARGQGSVYGSSGSQTTSVPQNSTASGLSTNSYGNVDLKQMLDNGATLAKNALQASVKESKGFVVFPLITSFTCSAGYLGACAQVPRGLRIRVGCPLDMPVDFTDDIVEGYNATSANFSNGTPTKNRELFEGDMRAEKMPVTKSGTGPTRPRGAVVDPSQKWPNNVMPYVIDSTYSDAQVAFIKQSMCNFYKISCVRFKPRSNEDDFIKIKVLDGCWSSVGRIGGKQYVSLQTDPSGDTGVCVSPGIPEHELMHAFGFMHEQSRTDRDSAVVVNFANIEPGQEDQFEKYKPAEFDDFGEPYDTTSIMQYDSFAFSVSTNRDKPTMLKLNGDFIADPTVFSASDVTRLNDLYGCTSTSRPDDSSFDMTCSSSDPGTDNGQPDDPSLAKIKGFVRFDAKKRAVRNVGNLRKR